MDISCFRIVLDGNVPKEPTLWNAFLILDGRTSVTSLRHSILLEWRQYITYILMVGGIVIIRNERIDWFSAVYLSEIHRHAQFVFRCSGLFFSFCHGCNGHDATSLWSSLPGNPYIFLICKAMTSCFILVWHLIYPSEVGCRQHTGSVLLLERSPSLFP